jgi:hypothetical protein
VQLSKFKEGLMTTKYSSKKSKGPMLSCGCFANYLIQGGGRGYSKTQELPNAHINWEGAAIYVPTGKAADRDCTTSQTSVL